MANSFKEKKTLFFSLGTVLSFLALLFTSILKPQWGWLEIVFAALFIVFAVLLLMLHRAWLQKRATLYGTHMLVMIVLVISLVGVVNFLAFKNPLKFDLTQNKIFSLSNQTRQVLKGLKQKVHAEFYAPQTAKFGKEYAFLKNYEDLNALFELELVDPNRNILRARQAGIKMLKTLVLRLGGKKLALSEVKEEQVTNALLKLIRKQKPMLCFLKGHGELDPQSRTPQGVSTIKKALEAQVYQTKVLRLVEEGTVPETCTAVVELGPKKAFFPKEVAILETYLKQGGRGLFALGALVNKNRGNDALLVKMLARFGIALETAIIVDPISRLWGMDASVPLAGIFSKTHPVSKKLIESAYFPLARPMVLKNQAVQWIVKTTRTSWGERSFQEISAGKVRFEKGQDIKGPIVVGAAFEKKLEVKKQATQVGKHQKKLRLVVFGSGTFMSNHFTRFGSNEDLFLNAVSWVLEDEQMITIRKRKEERPALQLTQVQASMIQWTSQFIFPLLILGMGLLVWWRRRKY